MRKTRRRSRRRKQRGGDYEDIQAIRTEIASLTNFMESWLLVLAKNQVEIGTGLKKVPGYNAGLLAASPKKKVAMKIKVTSAFTNGKKKTTKGGRRKSRRKKRRKSRKSRRKRRKRSRRRRR